MDISLEMFDFAMDSQAKAFLVGVREAAALMRDGGPTTAFCYGALAWLSVAAYLTWDGKLIEGKGVSPSIPVEMKPQHLLAGEDLQMQRALDTVSGM